MKTCRICIAIRYFLAFVLFLIIVSITLTDELHYFSFVTPWNAVKLIFFFGFCLFVYKILEAKSK